MAGSTSAFAASTVKVDGTFDYLDYEGDDGVNDVVFTDEPAPAAGQTRVTVSEVGVVAVVGGGCVQVSPDEAYCDISNGDEIEPELAGGNDVAVNDATRVGYRADGGEGDDLLIGGDVENGPSFFDLFDSLFGGDGKDTLIGRAGNDDLKVEAGDGDVAEGGEGDDDFGYEETNGSGDVLRGGPGFDSVSAGFNGVGPDDPVPGVTIDLSAGTVQFSGAPVTRIEGMEDASGDDGSDTMLGSAGSNSLDGDEGNDFIDGRGGPDRLDGDEGDDRLEGRDGFADALDGAEGTDTCDADQLDSRLDCEAGQVVELPPFGSIQADRTAPRCPVRGVPKRAPAGRARKKGIVLRTTCDEAGRVTARLVGSLRRPGRRVRLARSGDIELAVRSRRVSAGRRVSLRLRAGRKLSGLVRKGARLRVVLVAEDTSGNERTAAKRVRVR